MIESTDAVAEWSDGKRIGNPIRDLIPKELQPSVTFLWMFFSDILKGKIGLCTRIKMFLADGLDAEDIKIIFRKLTRP